MNSSALVVFVLAQATVIGFTLFFFYKVLFSQHMEKHEEHNPKTYDVT
ncbi:MAG: hypothetical protein IPN73_13510 [Saprospiraceae bacterium]|nr:hypothetical protein [Saprospiraceae bacterium]